MIIDFEHHIMPEVLWKKWGGIPGQVVLARTADGRIKYPLDDAHHDLNLHFEFMDAAGIDMIILTQSGANDLEEAKIINDEFSKFDYKYPKRIASFATVPALEGKATFTELERSIKGLGLKGVTIEAQVKDQNLDSPQLWPFYEAVAKLNVPIFVHVTTAGTGFDAFDAPYDLSRTVVREISLINATVRLVLGGVLEDFPDLKFVVAHFGGGISSLWERIERYVNHLGPKFWYGMEKPPISKPINEYFNQLYFNMAGREIGKGTVKCALTNISPQRLVFGTDYPPNFVDDPQGVRSYIEFIRSLEIDRESIDAMLGNNAAEMLGLKS